VVTTRVKIKVCCFSLVPCDRWMTEVISNRTNTAEASERASAFAHARHFAFVEALMSTAPRFVATRATTRNKRKLDLSTPLFRARGYRTIRITEDERAALDDAAPVVRVDVGPVTQYTNAAYDGDRVLAPWDTKSSADGIERVGKQRAYAIERMTLDGPSTIVTTTRERPLGLVFEPDTQGRVRVSDFVRGSDAEKASKVSALSPDGAQCAKKGDVLRAFSATQISFTTTTALLGDLSGTKRVRTLFGCDGESWDAVRTALTNGRKADGAVTMIFERLDDASKRERWDREEVEVEFRGLGEKTTAELKRERARAPDESQTAVNGSILAGVAAFVLLIAAGFM